MSLTEQFLNFALLGAEWVMWLLVGLSIVSVGVMIERGLFLRARRVDIDKLSSDAKRALRASELEPFEKRYEGSLAMAAQVAVRGMREHGLGVDTVSESMNSEKTRARKDYERYLVILGTLGNNAPFIGLFGTVIGVIQAFQDLSSDSQGGAEVVMSGISEALVATAVGLIVAIPAVIAFNYFNRRVREAVTATDDIAHTILAELHRRAHEDERARKEAA
jgi:biopolymer transport protein ExbB/TolQ